MRTMTAGRANSRHARAPEAAWTLTAGLLLIVLRTPRALPVLLASECMPLTPRALLAEPSAQRARRDWSEAALGGAPGARAMAMDLARAHVGQRMFGPVPDLVGADEVLVELLEGGGPLGPGLLEAYAARFDSICALPASQRELSAPQVIFREGYSSSSSLAEGVALITPGAGEPLLPEGTEIVVVDLRELAPGALVEAAASLALASEVPIGQRRVRRFDGFPQASGDYSHYQNSERLVHLVVPSGGERELPLYFLTGQRLTPEAATIAAGLRLAGRAGLIGHEVHSAVAESTWSGIGNEGLLWRSSALEREGKLWPDVIPADVATSDPQTLLGRLAEVEYSGPVSGASARPGMKAYDRLAGEHEDSLSRGAMRAALLVAYGTFDWFYPLITVVGRDMDQGCLDALAAVDGLEAEDRAGFLATFGRFLHDLHDSHGYAGYVEFHLLPDDWMSIQIQGVEGEPVVRFSGHAQIAPGDTIVSIDGEPAPDWYAREMAAQSAATEGYLFAQATSELEEIHGVRRLGLRSPEGELRTVSVEPGSSDPDVAVPWAGVLREHGWLDELGAADTYYLNLSSEHEQDHEEVLRALPSILGRATGVVLDMRGYPEPDTYDYTQYFNPEPFEYPMFENGVWNGPTSYERTRTIWWGYEPAETVFAGPVALLVGNRTLSFAETLSMAVESLDNVTVTGQQSAGSNGTITGVRLPGGLEVVFTGQRLLYPDGSEFHGIGIQPDVEVVPTPAQFAAGIDPELEVAIELLTRE